MRTIKIPEILLPADTDHMQAWAVNACDQYTSDLQYWENVQKSIDGFPSAYHLIYPEIYLNDETEKRIALINETMREYLENGIFKTVDGGFILVERTTQSGTRTGIVLSIDLEDYSYEKGAKTLIRSTEATILERIPPRVRIRENAPIELPHAMLLYEDKKGSVLQSVKRGDVLYDFDLISGGGHVKGTYITNAEEVTQSFYSLIGGKADQMLFAVGDGNHSLATAKTCWEQIKTGLSEAERANHPARFALVEAVNIYDSALTFEPIHRLIKTEKSELFCQGLKTSGKQSASVVVGGKRRKISFHDDIPEGIRQLDRYIADFIAKNGGEVDYIHGEEELIPLTAIDPDSPFVGVLLPSIEKDDFFTLIKRGGNLPRKTFSMGEGNEKRYYIEAKKIR